MNKQEMTWLFILFYFFQISICKYLYKGLSVTLINQKRLLIKEILIAFANHALLIFFANNFNYVK